jgi:hypothetical protein
MASSTVSLISSRSVGSSAVAVRTTLTLAQRGPGERLVEIFANQRRLDDRMVIVDQRRHDTYPD